MNSQKEVTNIKTFTLRLPDDLHDMLGKRADEAGLSKNDYLKMLLENDDKNGFQKRVLDELAEIKSAISSR